jgi:diadenosine tetraphosphatase ApaH/serine/threonine PP2A family protein phosphatase
MESHRIAFFSDIHGNLEALKAVLADMGEMGVQDKFCLGDIVGYGPDPAKCLELIRNIGCPILLGNHDEGCFASEPDSSFNTYALAALDHARRQLSDEQKDFLKTLPMKIEADGFIVVHASLCDKKAWSYVLDTGDAISHFEFQRQPVCFCGHTHKPAVWREGKDNKVQGLPIVPPFTLDPDAKYLINVGSVGQSRTLNSDACYVVYDTLPRKIEYRFVPYAFKKTQNKIIRAGLPRFLAQRLALGR